MSIKPENLYLINIYNDYENFYKIGTSVHRYCRFYEIMKSQYNIKIVYMILGLDFYDALNKERELQNIYEEYMPFKKFGGYTECFKNIDIDDYKKRTDHLLSNNEVIENLEISWR